MIFGIALLDIIVLLSIFSFGMFSAAFELTWGICLTFVAIVAAAIYLFGVDPYSIHPLAYAASFFGYFLIGGIYTMIFSWPNYIRRNSDVLRNLKSNFDRHKDKGYDSVSGLNNWKDQRNYKELFTAAGQKSRIIGYICGWFWDLLWKTLRNPIKWTYDTVYNLFGKGYEAVATKTVDKIIGDDK